MCLIVYCTICKCRMDLSNKDDEKWFEFICIDSGTFYCSFKCMVADEQYGDGSERVFDSPEDDYW